MSAPTARQTDFGDGLLHIIEEPIIWVRVAAVQQNDGTWHARLLELTSGAAPPSWKQLIWDYPEVLLAGETQTGQAVVRALGAGKMTIANREIILPQTTQALRWERQQSHWPGACEPLAWPSWETTFGQRGVSYGDPQWPLVSEDTPSFLNFFAAAACFFWASHRPTGGTINEGVYYRHQDTRGRVNRVRIGTDSIEVEVEGTHIGGMTVELAGEIPGPTGRIPKDSGPVARVVVPLKGGLPAGAWVLARLGGEWIDRRYLTVPWSQSTEPGVEIVVEPRTRLEAFIANREGQSVEFKRQIPSDDESKAKVMKTVCAFANGEGGAILFGIDDDYNLVGLPAQTIGRTRDQIAQMVDTWVEPRPNLNFEVMPLADADKVVLELQVRGGSALFGCGRSRDARTPYIRRQAITVPARLPEIEEIVRSRSTAGQQVSEIGALLGPETLLDEDALRG